MTGDPMDLLEQLKQQYQEEDDPLAGRCLVIPEKNFQRTWIDELRAQGCEITQGNRGLHPFMFVSLPKQSAKTTTSTTSTESPEPTKAQPWLGKPWTKDEDKEIIKGVTLGLNDAEIAKRLPGRTEVATKQRRQRLEKHGIIQRKKGKQGRPPARKTSAPALSPIPARDTQPDKPADALTALRPDEADAEGKSHPPTPAPAPQPRTQPFTIHTTLTINLNVNCNDAFSVQNALKVLQEARRA